MLTPVWSTAAFMIQWQSQALVTEIIWSTKPQIQKKEDFYRKSVLTPGLYNWNSETSWQGHYEAVQLTGKVPGT